MDHLKNLRIPQNWIFVSFDVTNLYTKLPIPDSIQAVKERLQENNNWKKGIFVNLETEHVILLLNKCLNNTYFQYNNELHLQNDGCPMGSPISGTIADIYLQKLESFILSINPKIIFWKRYVDDILAIIEGNEDDALEIKNILNSY